jgi:hypothetical protein
VGLRDTLAVLWQAEATEGRHKNESPESAMGLATFLNLEGIDIAAFLVATLLGYLAGTFSPETQWAVYAPILIAYHLFLAWLVVRSEQETGISLPVVSTIMTHIACLLVLLFLGGARHYVPFFGIFRYSIPGLAVFERGWLFSGTGREAPPQQVASTPAIAVSSSGDDFEEWKRHLAQRSGPRKPGSSIKAEYEQWLLERNKGRSVETVAVAFLEKPSEN